MAESKIKQLIKTATLTSGSVTVAGSARTFVDIPLPSDCKSLLSATILHTPNADWVISRIQSITSTEITIYYKNEYSGPLSGSFDVLISYM